jgi:hypothetical protein
LEEEALSDPGWFSILPTHVPPQQYGSTSPTPVQRTRLDIEGAVNGDGIESIAEVSRPELPVPDNTVVPQQEDPIKRTMPNDDARRPSRPSPRPGKLYANLAKRRIMPVEAGPKWLRANTDVLKAYACPTNEEVIARVRNACEARDARQLSNALRLVIEVMEEKGAPANSDEAWIEATALLCRTCQEEGRVEDAARLLNRVISRGPLKEDVYFRHNPFPLIESLLARAELSEHEGVNYRADTLSSAINLFLPTFTEQPAEPDPQAYQLGRRLLEMAFSTSSPHRVIGLFRRCFLFAGDSSENLTSWFLTKLYEMHDYKSVVKIFLSTYAKTSPLEESVGAIGDRIVDSVKLAHNYRADEVLENLYGIYSSLGHAKMKARWVMELLTAHWAKHRSFEKIESLFALLGPPNIQKKVVHPEAVYRVMVELALDAGEEMKAESYFRDAVAQDARQASDVRLLGVLARSHAKNGDWEAVRSAFAAMNWRAKANSEGNSKAYGHAFVPILKEYIQHHTIRETEEFAKFYIDEFKVPLSSYTVTLMAKQYAAIRDVRSLIDWLEYCSRAGFTVDAAFSNAILVSCRRDWKFPFRDLRTLFRKLRSLNPDFVDRHTERIMADAALSASKYGGKAAKGRLLSLRIDPSKVAIKNKCTQVDDVRLAMKEAITCHRPESAVRIYKLALHQGMPFCPQILRLAVQARFKSAPNGLFGALELIRDAEKRGQDTEPAINYLLAMQLAEITATRDPTNTLNTIQTALAQFKKLGIHLTDRSLHRAALTCLEAGHFQGAIGYALKAAEAAGMSAAGPCYNLQNFKILLSAYAELVDVPGIRDTVRRALASRYREDTACLRALKHARAKVAHATARGGVTEAQRRLARAAIDGGIDAVVNARENLRHEAKQLGEEALRIMKRAALDAGCPPVDFEDIPWLGGGKGKGERNRAGGGNSNEVVDDDGDGDGGLPRFDGADGKEPCSLGLDDKRVPARAITAVEAF